VSTASERAAPHQGHTDATHALRSGSGGNVRGDRSFSRLSRLSAFVVAGQSLSELVVFRRLASSALVAPHGPTRIPRSELWGAQFVSGVSSTSWRMSPTPTP